MGITWTPYYIGHAKFGAMYGMATGYDKYVPAVPIACLYGTYERKCYGINVYWLPSVVIAVQLKVKI